MRPKDLANGPATGVHAALAARDARLAEVARRDVAELASAPGWWRDAPEISRLASRSALRIEGDEMDHCVGDGYDRLVGRGLAVVVSVRIDGERSTADIRPSVLGHWYVASHRGPQNKPPSQECTGALDRWLHSCGIDPNMTVTGKRAEMPTFVIDEPFADLHAAIDMFRRAATRVRNVMNDFETVIVGTLSRLHRETAGTSTYTDTDAILLDDSDHSSSWIPVTKVRSTTCLQLPCTSARGPPLTWYAGYGRYPQCGFHIGSGCSPPTTFPERGWDTASTSTS